MPRAPRTTKVRGLSPPAAGGLDSRRFPMRALVLSLVVSFPACGGSERPPPHFPPAGTDTTLGPSDIFDVRVYDEPTLTNTYRVAEDGTIDFPLVGRVAVTGMRPPEIADLLRTRLQDGGFLTHPQVSVLVKEYNSKRISVFGQVQHPGNFPFTERMHVVQAISLAGGFTAIAAKNETIVSRRVNGRERRVRVPVEAIGEGEVANFYLRPGDIIFVPERAF